MIFSSPGGKFSNQTVLLAWAFQFIQPTILALLTSYNAAQQAPPADVWPATDYDTIWTVKLDAHGNLTVNNAMCEGINSARCRPRLRNSDALRRRAAPIAAVLSMDAQWQLSIA